jgi:hypothetical protein
VVHTRDHSFRTSHPQNQARGGQVVDADGILAEEVGDSACKASYISPLSGQPIDLSAASLSSAPGFLDIESGGEDDEGEDGERKDCNSLKDNDVRFPYTPYNPNNNTERYMWIQDCAAKGRCDPGGLCIQNDNGQGLNHPCKCS